MLLLKIPSATLDTLIDLMQPNGLKQFTEYLPALDHDARRFFDLKFNSREFDRTKEQVVDRLFAVKRSVLSRDRLDTCLDTPPISHRHHPVSHLAPGRQPLHRCPSSH